MKQWKGLIQTWNATGINLKTVGVIFGLSGMNHGFFECLQGNTPTKGVLIHAIGEQHRFWVHGTEDALSVIPNFMISGLLSMFIGLVIVLWSLFYIHSRHGRTVFLALFCLLFLVGGGIGQLFFFLPAWAFASQLDKPMSRWKKILHARLWPILSKAWPILLTLAVLTVLFLIEIAIFGFIPGMENPDQIQVIAMFALLSSVILFMMSFIAGYGHDLMRMVGQDASAEAV